jgi:amino acid adenylation domain-containing protein
MQNTIARSYRLSPQQKRLWSLHKACSTARFFIQCETLVEGPADTAALGSAIRDVVARHEILRTTFSVSEDAGCEQIVEEAHQSSVCKFDLAPVSPEKQELSMRIPSLCADRATMKNLLSEIVNSYAAALDGKSVESEPVQYADLTEWQNDLLESEETQVGRSFWSSSQPPGLPASNFASWVKDEFSPRSLEVEIGARALGGIDAAGQNTAPVFILTCWRILISRLMGRDQLAVAVAFDGRRSEEIEQAMGPLTKYIPVAVEIGVEETFVHAMSRVAQATAEAAKWQEYFDWERIDALAESVPPFPPVCFDFDEIPSPLAVGGVSFSISEIRALSERFVVNLSCARRPDRLTLTLEYDPNVIGEDAASRLAASLVELIRSAAAAPDSPIYKLNSVTTEEREKLQVEWNQTSRDLPPGRLLHHLIEDQSALNPNKTAVVCGDRSFSFHRLNSMANQLARHLQSVGVGPESAVAICLPRSFDALLAVLAVLKSGGSYVPVELNLPFERQSYIFDDAGVIAVITRSDCEERIPSGWATVISLDEQDDLIRGWSEENLEIEMSDQNLAYIIYTSGSTGRPKGVMIPHRGVVNYLLWSGREYRADEGSGSIVHSPLGFDLTVTSLLTPLAAGQRVILAGEGDGVECLKRELIGGEDYTLLKLTPSHLEMLRWEMRGERLEGKARVMVIGGEELRKESLKQWSEAAPRTRLINEYGPTETVVGCSVYEVRAEEEWEGVAPIGRPIWNTKMYVLGKRGELAGIGVEGEICVGGAGVGRGYVGKADQTAEVFIPDEYGGEEGARLYRTGDLGRVRADGVIEYLGRRDGQVKLRGYRIELGEIEEQMKKVEGVREAVAAIKGEGADRRLIGYVVEDGVEVSEKEIRGRLERELPEYMRPSAYVKLVEIPLNGNGKVNREALPRWEGNEERGEEYEEARTPVERELAEIWKELLGLKRVGIHDNFFELGGHSLLATQIISSVREAFQVEAPLTWFFTDRPTVANMAELIEGRQIQQSDDAEIAAALEELGDLSDEEVRSLLAAA